jgi:hypothetical protein
LAALDKTQGALNEAEAKLQKAREALTDLCQNAQLLQQNAEGCAVNHYGNDHEIHGLPGWLSDTQASIDSARAILKEIGEDHG